MRKKKSRIVVAIAMLFSMSAANAKRLSYGPKLGANVSFINNLDKIKLLKRRPRSSRRPQAGLFDIVRTAFHGGTYVEYACTPRFSTGAEMVYSRVGSVYKKYALRLSYVSIPVWGMFRPTAALPGLGLYAGPQFDFLWRATPEKLPILQEEQMNVVTISLIGGVRHTFGWGLCIDLRYDWGLTNIFDTAAELPKDLKKVTLTNHCLQLSVGYDLSVLFCPSGVTQEAHPCPQGCPPLPLAQTALHAEADHHPRRTGPGQSGPRHPTKK